MGATGAVHRIDNHTDEPCTPLAASIVRRGVACAGHGTELPLQEGPGLTKPDLPFPT